MPPYRVQTDQDVRLLRSSAVCDLPPRSSGRARMYWVLRNSADLGGENRCEGRLDCLQVRSLKKVSRYAV